MRQKRQTFSSDHGSPCWRCDGTVYEYTVDGTVTYIAAWCVACGGNNMFAPQQRLFPTCMAADVSAAHRAACGEPMKRPCHRP